MNKRNLQQWELRLGVVQLVMLTGIVTGSMACAFYIGFTSGRAVGFESALERSLANVARIPIASEGLSARDESTTEVYAKLSQPAALESDIKVAGSKEIDVPLGAIQSTDVAPVIQDLPPAPAAGKQETLGAVLSREAAASRMAQESTARNGLEGAAGARDAASKTAQQPKTLGSLINEKPKAEVPVEKFEKTEVARASQDTSLLPAKPVEAAKKEREAPKAVKEQRPSGLVRDKIPAGWFAQVAAPRKMQDANSLAARLKASGFPVMIEVARVRGDEYYRVLVGPEQGRAQADRLVGQLKRESYIQGAPFLRVVK